MFQFTTTNIINSLADSKVTSDAASFFVKKVGKFLKTGIASISKRSYSAAVKEVATITITNTGVTAGDVLRLAVDVQLSQSTAADYANDSYNFSKPSFIEIIATGVAATDAAALKAQYDKIAYKYQDGYFTVGVSGAVLTFTALNGYQRFASIVLTREDNSLNSIIQPLYTSIATGAVTVKGSIGFGNDEWMAQRIMIPTAENVRYFGLSLDERPILGGNYTQYTIRYSIDKDGTDGINGGGKSITTHVFYVLSSLQATFEDALEVTYPGIIIIGGAGSIILSGDTDLDVSDGDTTTLTAANYTGAIDTWVSSTPGVATVAAGLVTAIAAGTTTITATDTDGNTGTLVITVVA